MEYYKNLDLKDITYFCEIDLVEKIEQWEDIPEYDGKYQASDLGRLKSFMPHNGTNERIMKQKISHKNYLHTVLYKNRKGHFFSVHRAIALTFIPNPENKPEVNHIGLYPDGREGNKLDNRVVSLVWATKSENRKHAFKNGLNNSDGSNHSRSKLTEGQVLEIRASTMTNLELSKIYDSSALNIYRIRTNRAWKHI